MCVSFCDVVSCACALLTTTNAYSTVSTELLLARSSGYINLSSGWRAAQRVECGVCDACSLLFYSVLSRREGVEGRYVCMYLGTYI
jgi:hypothetical protein